MFRGSSIENDYSQNTSVYKAFGSFTDNYYEILYVQSQDATSESMHLIPYEIRSGNKSEKFLKVELDSPLDNPVFYLPYIEYVALGDSFSSGTGASDYFSRGFFSNVGTDCHRSENAYAMALDISASFPGKVIRRWFYACHGAETRHLLWDHWDDVTAESRKTLKFVIPAK
ncbi:MAG: hypothetical protein EA399_00530, partial [Desulfovibrionales bacterium]